MKRSIAVIGGGNVAVHMANALKSKANVVMVNSRTLLNLPSKADLYIISVSDDVIESVVSKLPGIDGILCHTSGSRSISCLDGFNGSTGVLYPLQTFSKGTSLDYSEIPIFTEADNDTAWQIIDEVAHLFSGNVHHADFKMRRCLHVAAVFASNYVNYLWSISSDILADGNMKFDMLQPLISETMRKAIDIGPLKAQTGPARRHDAGVIESHIEFLSGHPDIADLYRQLSCNIKNKYPIQ